MASGRDSTGQCATDGTGDNTTEIVETTPVTRALATPPTTAPGTAMAGPTSNAGMGEEITVETISSGVFPAI